MKIIVDTSIFMSALISPKGICAELLMNPIFHFEKYSSYYLVIEIFKHKEKILKYSKLTESELIEQVYNLLKNVTLINENQIPKEIWQKSYELTKNVDENDTAFVALTEYTEGKLWSLDKKLISGLKNKDYKKIIGTGELKQKAFENRQNDIITE
jgi:putative PIN family toxin of toxin-antitoxin system